MGARGRGEFLSGNTGRLRSARVRQWLLGLAFLLLLLPTAARIHTSAATCFPTQKPSMVFNDFRLFLRQANAAMQTGQLYDTSYPGYFAPGSPVYKYPPPLAAFLSLFSETRWRGPARVMLWTTFAILAATAAVLLWRLRPGLPAALLMLLVFLNWQPFWESIAGLQLEPALLLLLTLALFCWRGGREFLAGFFVGIAAALKVYPGALGMLLLAKRSGRAIAGIAAGGLLTLGIAGLRLSPAHSVEYFTRILPRLGGTSLFWENLGILGSIGRLTTRLLGGSTVSATLSRSPESTLESCGVPGAELTARIFFWLIAALLVLVTVWRLSAPSPAEKRMGPIPWADRLREKLRGRPRGDHGERIESSDDLAHHRTVEFAASICLLLPLMPTSWYDYQTLLALPALVAIGAQWSCPRDRLGWVLLLVGILPAVLLNANRSFTPAHPAVSWALRAAVPIGLWGVLLRSVRA